MNAPIKQQSPLERVGNHASHSIIEALEEHTVPLFNNNPLHGAMLEMMGGCPLEIRRSLIENATQYGVDDDNALYGLAVFDLYSEDLRPTGAVFTNPTVNGFKDIVFGQGGLYFNLSKLNELPLLVTDDIHLAFKTAYPVYAPYKQSYVGASTVNGLSKVHPDLCFIAAAHQKTDIERRYTDLDVKMAFIPEPPNFAMSQTELDDMIKAAIDKANGVEWDDIIPLDDTQKSKATTYPIQALPPLLRGAAEAIAEYVQAPIAMTAQCVIGAISHIAQAHVNTLHQFNVHGEPCSLFLITEGQSGSRKSTSKGLADKSIKAYELRAYEQYGDELQKWKSLLAGLSKKEREAYIAENPPPQDPSSLFSEGTIEAIAGLFIDGVINNASISSDEAAQFFGGHTMKSDTRTQALGCYTKLFDEGFVQRIRSKSNLNGSGQAYDVRLTFNLQGQHEVLANALKDDVLREQGFLPRFILTVPENLAGTRTQNAEFEQKSANRDHRLIAYWNRCELLLDPTPMPLAEGQQLTKRHIIQLSCQAKPIDLAFYNECEIQQNKGGKYEHIQPFASRASQLARRLATVFAFFQGEQEITAQTMQGACDIIRHSLGEWLRYADIEPKKSNDAELLLKWFAKQKNTKILKTSISTNVTPKHLRNANIRDVALEHLSNCGYIKIEKIGAKDYAILNPNIPNGG